MNMTCAQGFGAFTINEDPEANVAEIRMKFAKIFKPGYPIGSRISEFQPNKTPSGNPSAAWRGNLPS